MILGLQFLVVLFVVYCGKSLRSITTVACELNEKKNIFGEYIIFELILNVKLMSGIEQVACH